MFSKARWSLTLWFAGAMALILGVTEVAVYLTTRFALFNQVNYNLQSKATQEARLLAARLIERRVREQLPFDIAIGPALTAGGYFYALATQDALVLAKTPNVDPQGLASAVVLKQALDEGRIFVDTKSSEGDNLRVYVQPVQALRERALFLQVGRSTEPERQALRRLSFILFGAEGIGVLLALTGGFFLAGRTLAPIRQAMEAQHTFVADASHELRTPLALIRANAELLKRHSSKPLAENMTSVDDMIQETDRLSTLVGQMLTLAQAETGQAVLNFAEVDLGQLAADTCREMQNLAGPKDINIEVDSQGGKPLKVLGDPYRLRELLVILLDNAIKYSDPGSAAVVRVQPFDGSAQIRVSDNGRGIPPEALSHIFERFYRADKARSREMGGTGLGLSIAKRIVESHRGTIRVESTLGKGTTVTVSLPLI